MEIFKQEDLKKAICPYCSREFFFIDRNEVVRKIPFNKQYKKRKADKHSKAKDIDEGRYGRHHKIWTSEEDNFLKKAIARKMHIGWIARHLRRKNRAVKNRAKRFVLSSSYKKWTQKDIEQAIILKEHSHTVKQIGEMMKGDYKSVYNLFQSPKARIVRAMMVVNKTI